LPFIIIIVILAIGFAFLRSWIESRPGNLDPVAGDETGVFAEEGRINVLFLGTNQGLSDTMMVFSIDTVNKTIDEISVPRDTYYERPAYPGAAYQKINSVLETEDFKGCAKAVSDVLCGIPIHYYAEITDDGVRKIVDAMGGVEIDVPIDMQYTDVDQDLYIDLRAGRQVLTGDQAVQYLRFRSGYANADLGRIGAQQEFLKAVVQQSMDMDLPRVAFTAKSAIETNIGFAAGMSMVSNLTGSSSGNFHTWMLPGTPQMMNGASYYVADRAATEEMLQQILAG
jgi:LCP family protein required for cell wall assembly